MIDGNTAALREYEAKQDRQETAQAVMEAYIQPLITEMGKLMVEVQSYSDDVYDWDEEILQMIRDELEL